MLTHELLRTRTAGKNIVPKFIFTEDPALLELAASLLSVYEQGEGHSRELIDRMCSAFTEAQRDVKLSRGIRKIIDDRAQFAAAAELDYQAARKALFLHAAAALKSGALPDDPQQFRPALFESAPDPVQTLKERQLYGDLPEMERLTQIKKTFPREVLERYNLALVQGLLLNAKELHVEVPAASSSQELRRMFKFLKFFRLLVTAERRKDVLYLKIDGPGSILENSTKYGLQLASFFPAVCLVPGWSIHCTVNIRDAERSLKLDHSSGLKSHFSNFSAYQPEEIRMFADQFRSQLTGWTLDDTPAYLELSAQKVVFPDFTFTANDDKKCVRYLELFHRWHSGQLEERLAWCETHPDCGLILGVDRSLLKKDGILKERLQSSSYFPAHGFLFRDYPGVANVLEKLG